MELLYCYVGKFRSLENAEVNLGGKYRCKYDWEKKVLTITEDPEYIEGFFGEDIVNVSAIVGKNGAGKSAVLEVLMGEDSYKNAIILVGLHRGTGLIYVWGEHVKGIEVIFSEREKIVIDPLGFPRQLELLSMVYFSNGAFDRIYPDKSLEQKGRYFSTFNGEIQAILDSSLTYNIRNVMGLFKRNECAKIIRFLKVNAHVREVVRLPAYIIVTVSFGDVRPILEHVDGGYHGSDWQGLLKVFEDKRVKLKNAKNEFLFHIERRLIVEALTYHPDFSVFRDTQDFSQYEAPGDLLKLLDKRTDSYDYVELYHQFADLFESSGIVFDGNKARIPVMELDERVVDYDREFLFYLFHDIPNLFQFSFSYGEVNEEELSSGELAMLSMFSRLYAIRAAVKYPAKHLFLLIDEGELYMHPSWQKQFVSLLVKILPAIYPRIKIQVVLTSHSPFVLSDLPRSKVAFLSRENNTVSVSSSIHHAQTFAANIHTLLADTFFMDQGLVGDFAQQKINEAIADMRAFAKLSKERSEQIKRIILTIGEPILRKKLLDLYEEKIRIDAL
jgi:hypothetical protein